MKNSITKDIQNHLEFMGYTIEVQEQDEAATLLCENMSRSNITVRIIRDLVMVRGRYFTKTIPESIQLFKLFDEINRRSLMTKWYSEPKQERPELVVDIECHAFGYDKEKFGKLLEQFEKEIRDYLPEFNNFEESK